MEPNPQSTILILVSLAALAGAFYWLIHWVMEAPRTPEPWGKEVEEVLESEKAVPVCHRCFAPQLHSGWFCPACGATVGPYCNYLPYVCIFSEGEVVRAGVSGRFRGNPVLTLGFLLIPFAAFSVAAPIYWLLFFLNLDRNAKALRQGRPPLPV